MTERFGVYEIEELSPGIYAIDDDRGESMYLVCGEKRALMIDTGSAPQPLTPLIRRYWTGPVDLVLTHAHFDHMYHSDEFRSVSLLEEEKKAWPKVLGPIVFLSSVGSGLKPKGYNVAGWRGLREGERIPLGGKSLRVIAAPGHTPGSLILADEADRLLFTGDAFGSGSYAWMWMPGCSCLSAYRESLKSLEKKLAPYRDYRMLGGHRRQAIPTPADPHAHRLDYETLGQMEKLCAGILSGEVLPEGTERNFGILNYRYRLGGAAVVLTRGKIK